MSLLRADNLCLGYDRTVVAERISFEVNKGDYLCIVGENGTGKTTLMKTLLGLQKPLSGRILQGDELSCGGIGYLPQQTAVQKDFPASVKEIVLSGCQGHMGIKPFYGQKEKKLARESMERLNILDLSGSCYRELSGGQQQRVLLARALCATDKLLLLDEPVSGLDPNAAADMYELIKGLNEKGVAIIMISHDIEAAVRYASHILHMGQNTFYGTRQEYLDSDEGGLFLKRKQVMGND
jgi:zinc transport system ATP-binding protein